MAMNPQLSKAVKYGLLSSGAAAAALPAPAVLAQEAEGELEQIVVTGSRIRRVDAETASPVFTLDRSTIAETGVNTIGDLLSQIPQISGAATNPQVNNGGGTGAAEVELRGLGSQRTLVLLNGRRLGNISNATSAPDVNVIPTALIERVEVLKEGAGAVYGSDAIGGVVNFITRTDFDGLELNYDYGSSDAGDGASHTVSMAWGASGEKGSISFAASYQDQEEISAGDRAFTREAIYFYTYVFPGGSSRTPTGRIRLPAGHPVREDLGGCSSVTRIDGADGGDASDYRCFVFGNDAYNYQPFNLVLTPQERASIFTQANYEINEDVEAYAEILHNYTTSGFEIAPLPFDAQSDQVVIPVNNVFNPFGISFGFDGETLYNQAQWRLEGLGTRRSSTDTTTNHIVLGLRGNVLDTGWDWDLSGTYSSQDQDSSIQGYLFLPLLKPAFGENFVDVNGTIRCGTPAAPIQGCVPVNPFNLESEQSVDALARIAAGYNSSYKYDQQVFSLSFAGDLVDMPAGPLQAAIGVDYSQKEGIFDTDFNTEANPPTFKECQLSNETCSGDSKGDYDVKEIYGELFVPVLKDMPGAYALNFTVGARYSDYSEFGDDSNFAFKLEYRPIADLLVRGSFTEVFRVPTIYDLYQAPASSASQLNDPCVGIVAADVAANPNLALACENVPLDGTFEQLNSQIDGLLLGDPDLKPETGDVLTYGLVYDPSWAPGLSMNVDFWDYSLENVITQLDVNTIADQCVATGSDDFCSLISRFNDGSVFQLRQPTTNFGKLDTSGVDVGMRYLWRNTPVGDFRFSVDATYTDKFDSVVVPGTPTIEAAGTYNRQYGNYAKWRGIAAVGWNYDAFNGLLSARYIDGITLDDPDGAPGIQPSIDLDSVTYLDLAFGYKFNDSLRFQVSVDNLTDEEPPLLYQNNVLNSNTDVSTYDLIGTYYRASLSYKF
jgi:outer membrane receptor protein involved in Fe transport